MKSFSVDTDPLDRKRFPLSEWSLVETEHRDEDVGKTETLFAVGNGYLGVRGTPEEGRPSREPGTYVNGFHETWPIKHAEEAYGFARTGQTIVNVPDTALLKIYVDDEPFVLSVADLDSYERVLDFRTGRLTRSMIWRTPAGKSVKIRSSRMVSFTDRHVMLHEVEITVLSGGGAPVVVNSLIVNRQDGYTDYRRPHQDDEMKDPRRSSSINGRVLQPQLHWGNDDRMVLAYMTTQSRMTMAVGADHSIETTNPYEALSSVQEDIGKQVYRVEAAEGVPVTVRKAVAIHTSRGVPGEELSDRCRRTLDRVREKGFIYYYRAQRAWLDQYWEDSDVEITGAPAVQQAVRWSLFQLGQATQRSDQLGVAAKGVTGPGYDGQYFWDTDVYVLPFLIYTSPRVARNVLRFRVNLLPQARERATVMAQRGALYPWRTINGEEASAYYAAGTAQYHINADVAHAFAKYRDLTGDSAFMHRDGAEVLIETARLWADLGFWRREADGTDKFHIHGVTGPDEYTTVVNNNLFTNVMARANLRSAATLMREMQEFAPEAYQRVVSKLGLAPAEVHEWAACADGMVVPFDEQFGIHPQDQQFLSSEMWDLENTPADKRPLLLHYHPLVIYRFQVIKQADVVLALLLQGDQFTPEEKRADFEYYDPITTGDSTLSGVVQSVIAAEVGYQEMAMRYFMSSLFVDLADLHGNARDGVHIASCGGVWAAVVYGFVGLRDHHGQLTFDPRLPKGWRSIGFPMRVRGTRMRVVLDEDSISFDIEEGGAISFVVRGEEYTLLPGEPLKVPLDGQGPRLASMHGHHPLLGANREDGSVVRAVLPRAQPGDDADVDEERTTWW